MVIKKTLNICLIILGHLKCLLKFKKALKTKCHLRPLTFWNTSIFIIINIWLTKKHLM